MSFIDEERARSLQRSGASQSEMAAILGVHTRTVAKWRKRSGFAAAAPRRIPEAERSEMAALAASLLADGAPISEVARTIGVSWPTVQKLVPEAKPWTQRQCIEHLASTRRVRGALS